MSNLAWMMLGVVYGQLLMMSIYLWNEARRLRKK